MFSLASTPFDLTIDKNATKHHRLVRHFPSYCGLTPTDFFPSHSSEVKDAKQNNLIYHSDVQVNDPAYSRSKGAHKQWLTTIG